jgi:hypothetical protein
MKDEWLGAPELGGRDQGEGEPAPFLIRVTWQIEKKPVTFDRNYGDERLLKLVQMKVDGRD